jgi:hypothetical protein
MRFGFRPPKRMSKLTTWQIRVRHQFAWDETREREDGRSRLAASEIVHSDESRFCANNDSRWVWRRKGKYDDGAYVETVKYALSIMVFGAIGKGYKSMLFFIDGSLNQARYIAMLESIHLRDECDELYGQGNWRFMQDDTRCHVTLNAEMGKCGTDIARWISQSFRWMAARTMLVASAT